jgi:hypothetical protein
VTQIVKTIPIQIFIIVNRNCFCVISKYRKINNNKGSATQEPFAPTIKLALSADNADSASNTLSVLLKFVSNDNGKFSYFLFSAPVFMLFRYYQRSMLTVFYIGTTLSGFILLIYLLLNSGSTGAYHSIMYGDFSMLIAGINALLSLLTNFNRTDKVLLALSALSALSASLIVGAKGSWVALPLLLLIFLEIVMVFCGLNETNQFVDQV